MKFYIYIFFLFYLPTKYRFLIVLNSSVKSVIHSYFILKQLIFRSIHNIQLFKNTFCKLHILFANTRISFNDMKLKQLSVSKFHGFLYLEEVSMFSQSFICSFFSNCRIIIIFFLLTFKRSWKNQMMLLPKIEGPHALDPLPLIITLLYFLFILEKKRTSALTLLSSCLTCFPFTNLSFPLSFLSQLLLKPFLLPLFSVLSDRWFS